MISTPRQLEIAKKQVVILQEALDRHAKTQPETEANLAVYADAMNVLLEIQAEIYLYSVRENLK